MKFEKLSENKIRITLSMRDLEEKDISFHDFMSNSLESQDLFLDMLEEAEEQIGFETRDCKVKIEALANKLVFYQLEGQVIDLNKKVNTLAVADFVSKLKLNNFSVADFDNYFQS